MDFWHECFCAGIQTAGTCEDRCLLCSTWYRLSGAGTDMEKRWGRLSISQRTGSYPCSALAPVQAPRYAVAGPFPPSHWAQMSGWEWRRYAVSWDEFLTLYLWHTEDTARAFRCLESCQWEHREVYKDMITCLGFAYTMWDSGYNLKYVIHLSVGSKQPMYAELWSLSVWSVWIVHGINSFNFLEAYTFLLKPFKPGNFSNLWCSDR